MSKKNGTTEAKRKERLESEIRLKVGCEEKAFRIVERLLEGKATEESLSDCAHFINSNHYSDIVEERAISKLCGYPLCDQAPKQIPVKQKYHISSNTNTVYDITERRNFCSNRCFLASKYFEKQIPKMPLWLRNQEPHRQYKFLGLTAIRGLAGEALIGKGVDEVSRGLEELRILDQQKSKMTVTPSGEKVKSDKGGITDDHQKCKKMDTSSDKGGITDDISSKISTDDTYSDESKKKVIYMKTDDINSIVVKERMDFKSEVIASSTSDSTKAIADKTSSTESDKLAHLMKLLDKRKSLLGKLVQFEDTDTIQKSTDNISTSQELEPRRAKSLIEDVTVKKDNDIVQTEPKTQIIYHKTDNEINPEDITSRNLQHSIPVETDAKIKKKENKSIKSSKTRLTPLSVICGLMKQWITPETIKLMGSLKRREGHVEKEDMKRHVAAISKQLDEEERDFDELLGDMKVGKSEAPSKPTPDYEMLKREATEYELKVQEFVRGDYGKKKQEKQERDSVKDEGENHAVLPRLGIFSQVTIRKKIVLEKLEKGVLPMLPPLRLSVQDVCTELRLLVNTFRLSSENISFKPVEWTLITLVLLKMLGRKQEHIEAAFLLPSASAFLQISFSSIGVTLESLSEHVDQLLADQTDRE